MTLKLSPHAKGFTLVEVMIVVAIIAFLAAIAVPGMLRARKRTQATLVLDNLRLIDGSKDQYASEYGKVSGTPDPTSIAVYLKKNIGLYNIFSSGSSNDPKIQNIVYSVNDYQTPPAVNGANATFSDVVDSNFWSPYSAN
jgi:prepilin-type N-terminal cleavage/methylation domain-containing protein